MNMTDSSSLLAEYVQSGSDAAFRELAARYLDLVYSTALRLVEGDAHRAEDIVQTVFVDLARMARTLPEGTRLGGWLHRHTCFTAAHAMRTERRRRHRETQAVEMNALLDNASGKDFSLLAPILDEAINELNETDRTAILLRFFEQHDFRALGQALGSSEDAARMRVSRALDKLGALLKQRGVTTSSAALAVLLSANAVHAAPIGLAVTVSAAALTAGAAVSTSLTAATSTTSMTLVQKVLLGLGATAIIGAGVYEAHQASALRAQVASLQQQAPLAARLRWLEQERDDATNRLASLDSENAGLKKNSTELLSLRGEVTRLRNQVRENLRPTPAPGAELSSSTPSSGEAQIVPSNHVVTAAATVRSGQTFAAGGWPEAPATRTFLLATPQVLKGAPGETSVLISSLLVQVSEAGLPEALLRKSQGAPQEGSPILTGLELDSLLSKLRSEGTNVLSRPSVLARDGQNATVFIGARVPNPDGTYRDAGTKVQVLPQVAQDGQTVTVQLSLEHNPEHNPATAEDESGAQ
jgi:RNA polymerase sigma factor (sigma-70 family)